MIREVYPGLWVGDDEAAASGLKKLAGYEPGQFRRRCDDCDVEFPSVDREAPHRCLDCALIEIAANWSVIHACKEPYHRQALGYTGRGAPADHDEYLIARRGNELCLNLVDMPVIKPQYTDPMLSAAFEVIDAAQRSDKRVLIHCNEGKSRAPTFALLWLGSNALEDYADKSFDQAVAHFREHIYPEYDPGVGMANYARGKWGYVEETTEASD